MRAARALLPVLLAITSGCKRDSASATPPAPAQGAPPAASASAAPADATADARAADAGARTEYRSFRGKDFRLVAETRGETARALLVVGGPVVALSGTITGGTHLSARQLGVPRGQKPLTLDGAWSADGSTFTGTLADPRDKKPRALSGSAGTFDKPVAAFKSDYQGWLAGQFVRMRLQSDGARLAGVYRYARSAEDIALAGTVDGQTGIFELTEQVGGKITGRFAGVLESSDALLATWSSPDGKRSFPIKMEPAQGEYPETVDLGGGLTLYPQERVISGDRCKADVLYPQVRGARDKAKQDALNAALRVDRDTANPCDDAPGEDEVPGADGASFFDEGYSLGTSKRGRFVGLSQGGSSYRLGAAHPQGGSTCVVLDTQTLELFRMVDRLTKDGRDKLGDKVTRAIQGGADASLTEQGYTADHLDVGPDTSVCLADAEISVQYQRYEVAPYYMGAPSAAFPKAEVRSFFEATPAMAALFAQ